MKVETLKKIVTEDFNYSWEKDDHWDDGKPCYIIGGSFIISQLDEPVTVKTVRGERETDRKKWLVELEIHDLGDRENPPDSDMKEIGKVDSLEDAVHSVLMQMAEDKINNIFESESLAELYSENKESELFW